MKRLSVLLMFLLLGVWVQAGNYGMSLEGESVRPSFNHTIKCDSAVAYFGYPDTTNFYDTLKLLPVFNTDSTALMANQNLDLDSIGSHVVKLNYYEHEAASISGTVIGQWIHDYSSYRIDLKIDTSMAWQGFGIGNKSYIHYSNDADTIFVTLAGDTIGKIVLSHPSDTTGGPADSTLPEAP